ncbi:hypothetical protein [Parasediminibacterium sp. JCM 36343]|uniref:hypothetical protein n=1 Tax=Parasediminibacterium sp. JCM 36343 TaxID=3374279 RepID=UPI003978824C
MKHFVTAILIIVPFLLLAQSQPTTTTSTSTRKQRAAARKAHIDELIKQEEEGALIYQKQGLFGLKFNTDGFDFLYEHGKYKTITKTNIWWLQLGERKQRNQYKQQPSRATYAGLGIATVGSSFALGKINNFYHLQLGFGKQRLIGGKGSKNGVAVSAIYGGGIVVGILKPYYVQYYNQTTGTQSDIKSTDSAFLDGGNILGASGFSKGLNELQFVPGLHARGAIRFDYAQYREIVSALEVGVQAEFYTQKIPLYVLNTEHNLFFNAYVSIEFGKRK